jgi:hypothetical protein
MQKPSLEEIEIVFKEVAKTVRDLYTCRKEKNDLPFINALRAVDKMQVLLEGDYKSLWLMVQEDTERLEQKCSEFRADLRNIIISQTEKDGDVVLNPEDCSSFCSSFSRVPSTIPHIDEDGTNATLAPLSRLRSISYESDAN